MGWVLRHQTGRVLGRGTYAAMLDLAEERGLARVLTCGGQTGDATWMPQWTARGFAILPAAPAPALRRAA